MLTRVEHRLATSLRSHASFNHWQSIDDFQIPQRVVVRSRGARRLFATEAEQFRSSYSRKPPPPPRPSHPSLPDLGSPSKASPSVQSAAKNLKRAQESSASSSSSPSASSSKTSSPREPSPHAHQPSAAALQPNYGQLPDKFGLNQHAVLPTNRNPDLVGDLEAILGEFKAPIRYAFAYGSGVFKQAGYTEKDKPMLDFIFAVSHPSHWHSININQHKDHYSLISRMFGSNVISIMQEKVGAGVWFNVECVVRGRIIKYGVISVDALVKDLMDWDTLYLAGRMQKPLHILRDEPRIRLANQVNLSSAVRAALLLLPETFNEEDLYQEIAGLSYRGDFRMRVGENPNKIKNIVASQGDNFATLYAPILQSFNKHISFLGPEGSGSIRQDVDPRAKAQLARRLPARLKAMLKEQYDREANIGVALGRLSSSGDADHKPNTLEELAHWTTLVKKPDFKVNLDKSIQMIVARPAFSQSAKGVMSVGPIRGLRYVWPKLKKKWLPSQ